MFIHQTFILTLVTALWNMSKSWQVSPPKPEWEWEEERVRDCRDYKKETKQSTFNSPGKASNSETEDCNSRSLTNFLSVDAATGGFVPFHYSIASENQKDDNNLCQNLASGLKRADEFGPLGAEWDCESVFKGSIFEFRSSSSLGIHSESDQDLEVEEMSIVKKPPPTQQQQQRTPSESSIIKDAMRPPTPEPVELVHEKRIKPKKVKKHELKALPTTVKIFKTHVDRDPNNINHDLKVRFSEIITEPKGFYAPKFSWSMSHEMYNFGKGCCYSLIGLLFGIPFAFLWGIVFAIVACVNVWFLTPVRRAFNIHLQCIASFWDIFVRSCCDPFYRSIGNILSKIRVRNEEFSI